MNLQFVTDSNGHKNGVLLPIHEWEIIQQNLVDYDKIKNKKKFFEGLNNAFAEIIMIKKGRKKPNSFEDLLNEL